MEFSDSMEIVLSSKYFMYFEFWKTKKHWKYPCGPIAINRENFINAYLK